jgi:hypothetical protein
MVRSVDIIYTICSILKLITKQLGLLNIPIIVCTDSFFLYKCLVKLGTTKEKCFMIDIIVLR